MERTNGNAFYTVWENRIHCPYSNNSRNKYAYGHIDYDYDYEDFDTMEEAEEETIKKIDAEYSENKREGFVSFYKINRITFDENGKVRVEEKNVKTICGFSKAEAVALNYYYPTDNHYTPNEKYLDLLDKSRLIQDVIDDEEMKETVVVETTTNGNFRFKYLSVNPIINIVVFGFQNDETKDIVYYTIDTLPEGKETELWEYLSKRDKENQSLLQKI